MIFSYLKYRSRKRAATADRPEVHSAYDLKPRWGESGPAPKRAARGAYDLKPRWGESGNVFFTLFGAVALVGVVGAATSTLMRGPIGTVVKLNQNAKADAQMQIAHKLAMLEAARQTNSGDCDSDGFVEPIQPKAAGCSPSPTGGGCLPDAVGSSKNDPWGTNYGYCSWDHGGTIGDACAGSSLNGTNASNKTVIAIISAGPDRQFQTRCLADNGGVDPEYIDKPGGSDDIVLDITYAGAVEASGGLWSLKSGDPGTAEIDKDIEVGGQARLTSGGEFAGDFSLNDARLEFLGSNSLLLLPTETTSGDCIGGNQGALRRNTAGGTQEAIEVCDFNNVNDWVPVGGSGSSGGAQGNTGDIQFRSSGTGAFDAHTGVFKYNPTASGGTLSVPNITMSGNLDVTGTVDAGDTTVADLFADSADITGTLDAGDTDIDGTLDVSGLSTLADVNAQNIDSTTLDTGAATVTTLSAATSIFNSAGTLLLDDDISITGDTVVTGDISDGDGAVTFTDADGVDISAGLIVTDDVIANAFRLSGGGGGFDEGLYYVSNDGLTLNTAGSPRLIVDSGGDVGIGLTNPAAMLDVNGAIKVGLEVDACDSSLYGAIRYSSADDELQICSMTDTWETVGTSGGGGGGIGGVWNEYTDMIGYQTSSYIIKEGSSINFISAVNGAGTRFLWYPSAGSLRAGTVTGTQWDEAQQGQNSMAFGFDTEASGDTSFAAGDRALATTEDAVAIGSQVEARATGGVALGTQTYVEAGALNGMALGNQVRVRASAVNSMGIGLGTAAGTEPYVSGANSLGIFMGDQSGVDLSASNTIGVYGGDLIMNSGGLKVFNGEVIFSSGVQTVASGTLLMDVEGKVGATHYCDETDTFCFTAEDVASGSVGVPGGDSELLFNSGGALGADPGLIYLRSTGRLGIGTGTPLARLHIADDRAGAYAPGTIATNGLRIENSNGTTSNNQFSSIVMTASSNNGLFPSLGAINLLQPGNSNPASTMTFQLRNTVSADSEIMRLVDTGEVGIGRTAPKTLLDVKGTLRIDYGNEACDVDREGGIHYNSSDDNFYVCPTDGNGWQRIITAGSGGLPAAGNDTQIQFNSGNELWADPNFVFNSAGKMGVGIANPISAIHGFTAAMEPVLTLEHASTDSIIRFLRGDGEVGQIQYDAEDDGFEFRLGGTTSADARMFIGDNGLVGIGNTPLNPKTRLDVGGTLKIAYDGEACDADRQGAIYFDSSGEEFYVCQDGASWQRIITAGSGGSKLVDADGDTSVNVDTAGDGSANTISFEVSGSEIAFFSASGGYQSLNFVPRLGDSTLLDIFADDDGTDDYLVLENYREGGGGYSHVRVGNEDVGILGSGGSGLGFTPVSQGGSAYNGALRLSHVVGSAYDDLWLSVGTENGVLTSGISVPGVASGAQDLALRTDNKTRIRIEKGGNIAIGDVVFASSQLHIGGTIQIAYGGEACDVSRQGAIHFDSVGEDFYVCQDGTTWQRIITAGTNSGLPAAGANTQIQFNSGNVLYASSGFVYTSAGYVGIGTASPAAMLEVAGRANIGGPATGVGNLFINGGNDTTIGDYNVAIGNLALDNLDSNCFFPDDCGYNVAIGQNAGTNVTTGGNNLIIGASAAASLTEGKNNIYLGRNAGFTADEGNSNVIIGDQAASTSPGSSFFDRNVVIGAGAAKPLDAYDNVILGENAAPNAQFVLENIIIGADAAPVLDTGIKNILIGLGVTTPSNEIENYLNIGNIFFGSGLYNGAASMVGTYNYCDENLQNCFTAADIANGAGGLWTDNTTHITYTSANVHLIKDAETLPAGFDANGTRMFWYASAGAFRGGTITGGNNAWQDARIGNYSFAFGENAEASGWYSVALGVGTTASGHKAFAMGQNTMASGDDAIAMGYAAKSTDSGTIALGHAAVASAQRGVAIGHQTHATGNYSTAIGSYSSAGGLNSTSIGMEALAAGNYSMAIGLGDSSGGAPDPNMPQVSGISSFGIFMGDQTGADITTDNTFAVLGAAGGFGINVADPDTALDVDGTLKIAYGGEVCDVDREGAIHFDSSADKFYVCANGTSWTELAMGTPTAATPDRGLQFNSGGQFTASSGLRFESNGNLVFTSGNFGVGTPNPWAKFMVVDNANEVNMRLRGAGIWNDVVMSLMSSSVGANQYDLWQASLKGPSDANYGDLRWEHYDDSSGQWKHVFTMEPSGKIGLGPEDPATKVDVGGTLKIAYGGEVCDVDREGAIHFDSSQDKFFVCANGTSWTELAMGTPAAASPDRGIQFNSGGSFEADAGFTFTSAGRVVIGTSDPGVASSVLFELSGNNKDMAIVSSGSGANNSGDFRFMRNKSGGDVQDNDRLGDLRFMGMANGTYEYGAVITAKVDGTPGAANMPTRLEFMMRGDGEGTFNNAVDMVLTSEGRLGIGEPVPATLLDVDGSIKIADGGETCAATADGGMIRWSGTVMQYCDGATWQDFASGAAASPAAPDRGIQFNSGGAFFASANFAYTTDGDLGIGTASPAGRLHVFSADDDSKLFIETNGSGSEVASISMDRGSVSGWAAFNYETGGSNDFGLGMKAGSSDWALWDANDGDAVRLFVDNSTGNIGVKQNAADTALDVEGTLKIAYGGEACDVPREGAIRFDSSTNSFSFCADDANDWETVSLGAGVSEIDDLTDAATNYTSASMYIGQGAGTSATGTNNVFLGMDAGDSVTTGNDNILIGVNVNPTYSAASNYINIGNAFTRDGFGNISIGAGSKDFDGDGLDGNLNVLIGYQAGRLMSGDPGGNVAIGSNAGENLTHTGGNTGHYNVLIGDDAGEFLTEGRNNILLGTGADTNVTTGDYNILLGDNASTPAADTSYHINIGGVYFGSADTGFARTAGTLQIAYSGEVCDTSREGAIHYNSSTDKFQVCANSGAGWENLSTGAGGTTAGGSDTYIQFNSGGTEFGGTSNFTWTESTTTLGVTGKINVSDRINIAGTAGSAPVSNLVDVLNDLSDVDTTGFADGEVLMYSAGASGWVAGTAGGTQPVGLDTQIQFNSGGVMGASANLIWDNAQNILGTQNLVADGYIAALSDGIASYNETSAILVVGQSEAANPKVFSITTDPASDAVVLQAEQENVGYSQDILIQPLGGLVGIGLDAPDHTLEVAGTQNNILNIGHQTAGDIFRVEYDGGSSNHTIIESSTDNFSIGDVAGEADWASTTLFVQPRSDGWKAVVIEKRASGTGDLLQVRTESANTGDLFVVDANGEVGIGNATPDAELDVTGDIEYTGTLTDVSDIRLKKDITPLDSNDVIGRLSQIDTYSFRMIDDESGQLELGVIAQEVEKVFPELVRTANDEMGTKSVNYVGFIAPLIEASKDLKQENDKLRAELAEMKAQQADILQEVKGLKAHTGYGVSKAEIGVWMLAGMLAMSSVFFLVGGILRNRSRRKE